MAQTIEILHRGWQEPLYSSSSALLLLMSLRHQESEHQQTMRWPSYHYSDVIMGEMATQITSLTIVNPTVYSGAGQRKHRTLAFVRGIYRRPVNSPHRWSITRKMFPFDDVIMVTYDDHVPHSLFEVTFTAVNIKSYSQVMILYFHWNGSFLNFCHLQYFPTSILQTGELCSWWGHEKYSDWLNSQLINRWYWLCYHSFCFTVMLKSLETCDWKYAVTNWKIMTLLTPFRQQFINSLWTI